jgi:hypothetical protein
MTVNPNEILRSRNFTKAKLFQRVMIFKNSLCSLKKSIMNKKVTIITLGILIAIIPFTGFPGGVKTVFLVIAGLAVAALGYVISEECKKCAVGGIDVDNNKVNENDDIPISDNNI